MNRKKLGVVILGAALLVSVIVLNRGKNKAKPAKPPADQAFATLYGEWKKAREDLDVVQASLRKADERRYFDEHMVPEKEQEYARRFLEFAQSYAEGPRAVDAVVWVCALPDRDAGMEKLQDEALELLVRHNIENPALAQALPYKTGMPLGKGTEKLLRTLREKSPHRQVQGVACFFLADVFRGRFTHAYYARHADATALGKTAEELFDQVAAKYGDVIHREQRLADWVQSSLYELRVVGLGKEAPDTVGEDIDGNRFKLSDYRGKVVLLSFWGFWCPHCRAMFPHKRELMQRFEGKPFVVLGVNSDSDRQEAKAAAQRQRIPWRSWWNSGSTSGPITRQWSVSMWPVYYVIDHKGVIRFKESAVRTPEDINRAVKSLLQEMEAEDRTVPPASPGVSKPS